MGRLIIIKVDGSATNDPWVDSDEPMLTMLQGIVSEGMPNGKRSLIEFVSIMLAGKPQTMVVNEEGLLWSLPLNHTATKLAGQPIVGTVAILKDVEVL